MLNYVRELSECDWNKIPRVSPVGNKQYPGKTWVRMTNISRSMDQVQLFVVGSMVQTKNRRALMHV